MVTDNQVRRLMKLIQTEKTFSIAASKAGMDEKTARKYRRSGKLPSEMLPERSWQTRENRFVDVWVDVVLKLELNPGLEAKTLFEDLQRRYPGRFADGLLRTLQRRIKRWRALKGPAKDVIFPQKHRPGVLCQSDFTHMGDLDVTIQGQPFEHLIYHFVLTYSNWETGTLCFSESFESLSEGLQNALWELGGAPMSHQTDRLTAAVNKPDNPEEFTQRYQGLLKHYALEGRRTQAASPHENGDIEQRHHRFKRALDQSLMLRGSRDFSSRQEYTHYIRKLFEQLNLGRKQRFSEEIEVLRRLPEKKLETCKRIQVKVGPSSTIHVNHNTYSVDSRLIKASVTVRLYAEYLEVWYAQKRIELLPRLRGDGKYYIQYRHIIDSLIRKPGAFENYRYRDALFPCSRFRLAYDSLRQRHAPSVANKEYLRILYLAAKENEAAVDAALHGLIDRDELITADTVEAIVKSGLKPTPKREVAIDDVELAAYDELLSLQEVA